MRTFSLAGPCRTLVAAGLAALVGTIGCGAADDPGAAQTTSDGLVFLVPTPGGGQDIARARLSDGAVQVVFASPDVVEFDPGWVPATLELVYTVRSADAKSRRVRLYDPEKAEVRSVLVNPGDQREPIVSPDGKRVAFLFSHVVPVAGKQLTLLEPMTGIASFYGRPPPGGDFVGPSFSPDGTQVAVQIHRLRRGDDVVILRPGGARKTLTDEEKLHDVGPAFGKAGDVVFFSRSVLEKHRERRVRREQGREPPMGGGDVCSIHVESEELHCLGESADAREFDIAPSPTRDEVVFVREQDGQSELLLAGARGEDVRPLTDLAARPLEAPRWSPDGERIAFVAGEGPDRVLLVVDREGQVLLETPGHSPSWARPFP